MPQKARSKRDLLVDQDDTLTSCAFLHWSVVQMKETKKYFFIFAVIVQSIFGQTTFQGNIAHTGVYESPGPKQFNKVKWAFKTGGPIVASPAVYNGNIFAGSADSYFYAVSQNTGQQIWKFKTEGQIASSAAIANDTIFFSSYDGGLYALDIKTGTQKWRFAMDYEKRFEIKGLHGIPPRKQTIPETWDFFTSSPLVFNGQVYFGSGDGNVYAVDALTGALKWKFSTGEVVHTSPAVAGSAIFIGSWNSNLYALDAATGKEKWKFEAGRDTEIHNQEGFTSSPAVVDSIVYVGCRDAHVYAIDAETGVKKWDFSTKGAWVSATPAIQNGSLYVTSGASTQFPAKFIALDIKTGLPRFMLDIKTGGFSSAALAEGLAYFGNMNGKLYAVETNSGKLAWEFQTPSSKNDPLKVLNADGSFNDSLTAFTFFDFQDRYVWMYRRFSVGAIVSSPVVDKGELYFGSTDGFLYALQ